MSLITTAKAGSSIPLLEAGTYPAICYGIVDIGVQYNETYKNSSPKLIISWEIPGETITIDGEEKPRVMSQTYTNSLSERSALRRDLVLWRGKEFTDAELAGFNLGNILGVPCLLTVIHTQRGDRTYANIGGIMKLPKSMEKPKGSLPQMTFDLDTDPLDKISELPEWIQERIKKSETYKERLAGKGNGGEDLTDEDGYLTEIFDEDGDLPF